MDNPTLLLADDRPRIKDSVTLLLATYFTVGAVADGAAFIAQELKPEVVVVDLTMEPTRSAWAVDELLRIDNQTDIDGDTPAWETVRASELELRERPPWALTAWPQRLTVACSGRRHSNRGSNPPLRPYSSRGLEWLRLWASRSTEVIGDNIIRHLKD